MTFTGWIYDEIVNVPWTKVFDINVQHNDRFSNVPIDTFMKSLVECDLYGYVKHPFISNDRSHCHYFIDRMFEMCGVNLKECFNNRYEVCIDGDMKFAKLCSNDNIINVINYCEVAAQVTVINGSYLHFNMTSYDFWCPVDKFIRKEFKSNNLGGWLMKLGKWPEIDKQFREILK